MKKAFKISAVLMALVIVAALAVAFSVGAAPTDLDGINFRDEMEKGGEFKLVADIGSTTDTEVIKIGENVVLDLNGHTITSGHTGEGLFFQAGVANPGTFKIIDSVGGGAIIAPNTTLLHNVGGTVRIEGGTIVTSGLKADTTTATITIQGSGKEGDGATKGTWTSFDPSFLVYGYTKVSEQSPAVAEGIFRVIPKEYVIKYVLPAGATHTNPGVYDIETPNITLTDPSAVGYDFIGWYAKEDGVEQKITTINTSTLLYDLEIVGKFEPRTYKINYNLEEGMTNALSNPATFNVTMADIKLAAPSKVGANFLGWYDAPTGGNRVDAIECSTTPHDVNVYPRFELIEYTITYVLYNGTVALGNPDKYTVETDTFTFNAADKTGYTFEGWYTDAVDGEKITGVEKGSTGNITVYARYKTIEYKITYDVKGNTVANQKDFVTSYNYETPTFALPIPELPAGKTFIGWINKDTSAPMTTVTVGSTGDINLEINVEDTLYKIFYYFGTGVSSANVNNSANPYEYFTVSDELKLKAATRAYYDFAGWFWSDPADKDAKELTKNAAGEWVVPAGTTNNVTVYAKWVPTEYDITYDEQGYMWKLAVDADGNYIYDANGNFTYETDPITGEKIKVPFTDGATLKDAPATYTYPAGVTIPSPTRVGYDFIGWYDVTTGNLLQPNSDGVVVIAPQSRNGDIELIAEWSVGRYDVKIEYQYNEDYYLANKAMIDALPNGRVFWSEILEVVYDTNPVFDVNFKSFNGFVPAMWTVTITNEDMIAARENGTPVVVYFEPVVLSTTYKDGKLVVTYFDKSTQTIDINSLASIKVTDSALVYVSADGKETTVASIPTQADVVELQNTVKTLNEALAKLEKDLGDKIKDLDDATKASINDLKGQIASNLTQIQKNASDIAALQSTVAGLQSQIDAITADDGNTAMIVAIIAAILAVIAAAGAAFAIFKK